MDPLRKYFYLIFLVNLFSFLFILKIIDRLSIDDFEVEDDVRPDFPCPYCYEDFDIASLCSHLEDEHSCESKVTVSFFPFISFLFLKNNNDNRMNLCCGYV